MIKNIRILPPFAVARLGSSPEPMENFDLEIDGITPRRIVGAVTLDLDEQGNIAESCSQETVSFRDKEGRIRPIAPFFEVWAQQGEEEGWTPLTKELLADCGLGPEAVQWTLHVANHKIYRRTNNPDDRIDAMVGPIRDHVRHTVLGQCPNFLAGESLPLGSIQYARPSDANPEIRARYIPAHGKVYRSKTDQVDPNVTKAIYDPAKGNWMGYEETDSPNNDYDGRRLTNPSQIFAGYDVPVEKQTVHVSYGYVDDECDGIIEA